MDILNSIGNIKRCLDPVAMLGTPGIVLLIALTLYWITLGFYRVFLSPIAKFPGPTLAALTTSYQAYFDIVQHGQFFKQLDKLHDIYGPIVRINPHELHVNDSAFIDELCAGSNKKRDKFKWQGRAVLLPNSLVATEPHDLHRKRRAAVNPYFSKQNVRKLDPLVIDSLNAILKRLDDAAREGTPWHASLAFKAATCDIITYFSFGESTKYMDMHDYNATYFEAVDDHLHMAYRMTYISWLGPLMDRIPPSVMGWVYPGLQSLWAMHERWSDQIEQIRAQTKTDGHESVFHGLLHADLPAAEKSTSRLREEAQLLVLAGQDTTAYTLSSLTYEILANSDVFRKLKAELVNAIPDLDAPLSSARLEQLPYLTAVIQEGIRLHPGALVRQSRVATEQSMVYQDPATKKRWTIPAGTAVCMDATSCNQNDVYWEDPHRFFPERWLENPRLDRYLISFSKGTRVCLGINLAYSELYLLLGGIIRRYDLYDGTGVQESPTLELHETTYERDIKVRYDCLVPFPTRGSKGVQVRVRPGFVVREGGRSS